MSARIADQLKAHNWLAVLIEFVIVVAGVFVGLQVNNWNADRDRDARTAKIVEAVRRDLRDANAVETSLARGRMKRSQHSTLRDGAASSCRPYSCVFRAPTRPRTMSGKPYCSHNSPT